MTRLRAVCCQPGLDKPSANGRPERDADSAGALGPSGEREGGHGREPESPGMSVHRPPPERVRELLSLVERLEAGVLSAQSVAGPSSSLSSSTTSRCRGAKTSTELRALLPSKPPMAKILPARPTAAARAPRAASSGGASVHVPADGAYASTVVSSCVPGNPTEPIAPPSA